MNEERKSVQGRGTVIEMSLPDGERGGDVPKEKSEFVQKQ